MCWLKEGRDNYILKQIVEELVQARKKFGQDVISIFNACFKEEKASEIDLNNCTCDSITTNSWCYNEATADLCYTTTTGTGDSNSTHYISVTPDGCYGYDYAYSPIISGGANSIHVDDAASVKIGKYNLEDYIKEILKQYNLINNDTNKEGEENNMFDNFNFDFGPIKTGRIMMSPYGPAVKAKNITPTTYYAFDANSTRLMDVKDCVFDFDMDFFWKIPVAPSALKKGDVVIQNNELYFVIDFENTTDPNVGVRAVNVASAKIETILPVCNMFNFNFITKVVPVFNMFNAEVPTPFTAPTADQPFGNIAPFLMMSALKGDGKSDMSEFFKTMMMVNMFNGGGNPFAAFGA